MDINPYAPPATETLGATHHEIEKEEPYWFAVPLWKLGLMSVCSVGIYEIYWFYRNWKAVKQRERSFIRPFWRAFFALLFCYSCFDMIRAEGQKNVARWRPAGLLAIGYIIVSLTWRAPEPYDSIAMLSFLFLLPVQRWANEVNALKTPHCDLNDRMTWKNWTLVVIGGTLLVFIFLTQLFPEWFLEE